MPEILYRDEKNKFSVYRLADIPPGVKRSGWTWSNQVQATYWTRDVAKHIQDGDLKTWYSRWSGPGVSSEADHVAAVLDEHAGTLLSPRVDHVTVRCRPHNILCCQICMVDDCRRSTPLLAPRFAVGMRVIPSAFGLQHFPGLRSGVVTGVNEHGIVINGGALIYGPLVFEIAATEDAPPDAARLESMTRAMGAQHGEGSASNYLASTARAAWSAHLRFLVERSEQERRARVPSIGWDPYGEDD